MTLQRLVLTFDKDAVTVRVLYRSKATSGPGPSTKARRREVTELARAGLREALAALDADDVILVGTSGFETREDTLSVEGRAA